jgi:Rieske Fe-S protein
MTLNEERSDPERRRFLVGATVAVGAVGTVALAAPFVLSMLSSARAQAAGAPVEVDISKVETRHDDYAGVAWATRMSSNWPGGFFCPCHGSKFDLSARVFKDVPAPINLRIPPYSYLSDTLVRIGDDKKGG